MILKHTHTHKKNQYYYMFWGKKAKFILKAIRFYSIFPHGLGWILSYSMKPLLKVVSEGFTASVSWLLFHPNSLDSIQAQETETRKTSDNPCTSL